MMPGCEARFGGDRYRFPCGLVVAYEDAIQIARLSLPTDDTPVGTIFLPMVTVAHRRHHEEQHDEMDRWRLVEILDPEGHVYEIWCECLRLDTHWHWGPFGGVEFA